MGSADYILKKLKKPEGGVERKAGSGRPRSAATPDLAARIKARIEENPKTSVRELSRSLRKSRMTVSRTIKRDLKKKSVSLVKSSTLSDKSKANRVAKCTEILRLIDTGKM